MFSINHIQLGERGEKAAAHYLSDKGYRVVATKYRTKTGEIDIIAVQNKVLVFVEVKTRRTTYYGYPSEAVNYRKQRKLIRTAQCYLKQSGQLDHQCRFDIIEILITDQDKLSFNHIINAFGE